MVVMPEIERLYQCIVCGVAWDNKQSLRAHMRKHRGEYVKTTFYAVKDEWEHFQEICHKHKTTDCHVLMALVRAVNEGEKAGSIDLARFQGPNPLVINVSHVFLGKPRSKYKIEVSDLPVLGKACHICGSRLISERGPLTDGFMEGSCLRCEARWLIMPKKGGE